MIDITISKIKKLTAYEIAYLWNQFVEIRTYSLAHQDEGFITVEQRELMLIRAIELMHQGENKRLK